MYYSYHFTHAGAMRVAQRMACSTGWRWSVTCSKNPKYPNSRFVVRPARRRRSK